MVSFESLWSPLFKSVNGIQIQTLFLCELLIIKLYRLCWLPFLVFINHAVTKRQTTPIYKPTAPAKRGANEL